MAIPTYWGGWVAECSHCESRLTAWSACSMLVYTLTSEPEEGAATAEYAVVLVAATGFAAVLVGIMKSDAVKTMLTNIIKKALSVG